MKKAYIAGTLGNGGAERQFYYALKELRYSTDIRVYCLTSGEFWESPILDLDIPVIHFGEQSSRLMRQIRLIQELHSFQPDVIESRHFYTNIYAAIAARVTGSTSIGAMRNDCNNEIKSVGHFLGNLCLRLPDVIASNSHNAINNAVALGINRDKFTLVQNIVDTEYFAPPSHLVDKELDNITVSAIGRFVKQKRFDRFLTMIHKLKNITRAKFKVLLVGDGPLRSALIETADRLELSDTVEFTGTIRDIREIYHQTDILVSTSEWEGMPNVVLEAMSCALPVIAFDAGDINNIIQDGENGYIIPQNDMDKAVEMLNILISYPQLRNDLGIRAREIIRHRDFND